ncbi:twin-arginine translocation signal domain-containing protein [Citrobacter freundii]|uniref:twin-arginine translocation signal domain-containing protein n=1 Tax=Citrobacter freundii TaxID=546 RepID=UPI003C6C1C31
MKLTRRDFIKTAGAATGTMAISSVIPMPAWAEGQNGGAILTAARWGAVCQGSIEMSVIQLN